MKCIGKTAQGTRCKRDALTDKAHCLAHEPSSTMGDRVSRLFKHFHPHRPNANGHQAWFRRRLSDSCEIDVTPKTISLWFKDGVPADRVVAVEEVVAQLEDVMVSDLEAKLAKVRG